MRPLTDSLPKPLLAVGGKPLIEYHLEALAKIGIENVVVNLAWKGALLRETLGDGGRLGISIHYSDEGDSALETGGGVFKALPLLGSEPFILLSGDIWSQYPLASLRDRLDRNDVAHFVLVPNPSFHAKGDFGLAAGRVLNSAAERYTYANIGVFRPEFFAGCREERFPLVPVMRQRIDEGRVSGELFEGPWRNIGTPAQLSELDRELSK